MALIAGAGNPLGGSNPAGTSRNINYLGDHAYAHSGAVNVDNNETTLIESAIGGHFIVSEITCNAAADTSVEYMFKIYLDDEQVMGIQTENDSNIANRFKMIIPPFANLKITAQNVTNTSTNEECAIVTGRVYA